MKKTKKILALALAAVMLVCTTVAATVAYLTANTGVVNNTFTVGSVAIELDEALVDIYGEKYLKVENNAEVETTKGSEDRVKGNDYKLIPGHTYIKDPTVYVNGGSEPCYVFVKVAVSSNVNGVLDNFAINSDWIELASVENVYYYKDVVDARSIATSVKVALTPVFTQFKVLDSANVSVVTSTDAISVDAYAVQADGFDSAAAAWTAAAGTFEN